MTDFLFAREDDTMPTKQVKKPRQPALEANGADAAEVMTLAEAAAWFRVPEDGLRTDVVAGRVPARLVAGEWRFNKASLVAWFGQPESEPESNRPKTGAELLARIQANNRNHPSKETPAEAEAFIAYLDKMRKTGWSEG